MSLSRFKLLLILTLTQIGDLSVCLEVLEDPQQMCESQHVACDGCLSDYFGNDVNKKKSCPVCREFFTWQSLTTSRILERALMTLKYVQSRSLEWPRASRMLIDFGSFLAQGEMRKFSRMYLGRKLQR